MALNATKPAVYSVEPLAKSFQIMTIATQGAMPIKIRPAIYSGWSGTKVIAKKNIKVGAIIQFIKMEIPKMRLSLNTSGKSS